MKGSRRRANKATLRATSAASPPATDLTSLGGGPPGKVGEEAQLGPGH